MTQDERNIIDFELTCIEDALYARTTEGVRENAWIAVVSLRKLLDVYRVKGIPNAVTAAERSLYGRVIAVGGPTK